VATGDDLSVLSLGSLVGVGRQQIVEFVPVAPNMVEEKVEFLDGLTDHPKLADKVRACWFADIRRVFGSFRGHHNLIAVARWQDTTTNPRGY